MAKYGSTQFSLFLVDGYNLVPVLSENATHGKENITQQTNPFGAGSEQHTPVGIDKHELNVGGGFFDPAVDAIHSALTRVVGIVRTVCVGWMGNVIGKGFWGYIGAYSQVYTVTDTNGQLVKADVKYIISGDSDQGVIVQHLATFTADWDTRTGGANAPDAPVDYTLDPAQRNLGLLSNSVANPTVITMATQHGSPIAHGLTTGDKILISGVTGGTPSINGVQTVTVISPTTFSIPVNATVGGTGGSFVKVNSNAGVVAYQQVTDYTGFTGFVGTVNDSPDDITYSSLVAFTDLAAVHSPSTERKLSAVRTVDRYLSYNGNVTGAGSITVFAGVCRL